MTKKHIIKIQADNDGHYFIIKTDNIGFTDNFIFLGIEKNKKKITFKEYVENEYNEEYYARTFKAEAYGFIPVDYVQKYKNMNLIEGQEYKTPSEFRISDLEFLGWTDADVFLKAKPVEED